MASCVLRAGQIFWRKPINYRGWNHWILAVHVGHFSTVRMATPPPPPMSREKHYLTLVHFYPIPVLRAGQIFWRKPINYQGWNHWILAVHVGHFSTVRMAIPPPPPPPPNVERETLFNSSALLPNSCLLFFNAIPRNAFRAFENLRWRNNHIIY